MTPRRRRRRRVDQQRGCVVEQALARGERQESKTGACNREQGRVGHGEPFRQVREDDCCKQQHQNPLEQQHWRASTIFRALSDIMRFPAILFMRRKRCPIYTQLKPSTWPSLRVVKRASASQ